jgi:NAD(P)-dependent dehydrogenase (short-subunit alcohol dehydrogenase family)
MLLKNKNVVIFAATGDIGRAFSQVAAREGANVYLSGRDEERVMVLADTLRSSGATVRGTRVDATDEVAVERYLMALEGVGVDVVFNAIGIRAAEGGYGTPAESLPLESFMRPVEVHLGSQFLTSRLAARQMRARKKGVIVTLSASLGKEARPFMSGVSAACGAIEAMTRALAAELSPAGVRVVCVRPGAMFETRTIQETIRANAATAGVPEAAFKEAIRMGALMQRAVTVEETANIVALVASDHASCLTGQVVDASCGMVLH